MDCYETMTEQWTTMLRSFPDPDCNLYSNPHTGNFASCKCGISIDIHSPRNSLAACRAWYRSWTDPVSPVHDPRDWPMGENHNMWLAGAEPISHNAARPGTTWKQTTIQWTMMIKASIDRKRTGRDWMERSWYRQCLLTNPFWSYCHFFHVLYFRQ